MSKRVLIFDALNQFIRSYIADPSLCSDDGPCGGVKGFIKSLQKIARETSPDHIIVIWDGQNGSRRKRKINAEYKEGRKPIKLNRNIKNLTDEEELENKKKQFYKLIDYLNCFPILQLMIDDVEADDIIAKVCMSEHYNGMIKLIVSSDKDFYQLCNNEVLVIRPIQKQIMNSKRILTEYNIHPNNFALARSIAGDKSDNLDGIGGAGLTTVAKRFPFLSEDKSYMINEIIDFSKTSITEDSKYKFYQDILDKEELIKENYKLMQLYVPNLSTL